MDSTQAEGLNISNPLQLEEWLRHRSVDTSQWGIGSAKTVENLWHEIVAGDSVLQAEPLLRRVQVASVFIYQDGLQLIETIQTFDDGRERLRNRAPSEKMKPQETPEAAAFRCLREEIGYSAHVALSPPLLIKTETIQSDSPSYPTLPTEFTFYTLELNVQGLPPTDFVTINQATDDPVRTTSWSWKPLEKPVENR